MYDASVNFQADVVDDGHYNVVIQQTGLDTADIDLRKWTIGSDYTQSPESDTSYHLSNCRSFGNKMTCQVSVFWWLSDNVEIDLSPANNSPSATIVISGMGGSMTLYPLTQADHDAVAAFLSQAGFPAG